MNTRKGALLLENVATKQQQVFLRNQPSGSKPTTAATAVGFGLSSMEWKTANAHGAFRDQSRGCKLRAAKNLELLNQGREAVNFPSALRFEALKAIQLLAPYGKSLLDAANFYVPFLVSEIRTLPVEHLVAELLKA